MLTVLVDGLSFPECPRWVAGEVWFVDTPHVKVVTSRGHVRVHGELPSPLVLGLSVSDDGTVLAGGCAERRIYAVGADGRVDVLVDLSDHFDHPTNELLVDPVSGLLLVGSMGYDQLARQSPQPSRLAAVRPGENPMSVGPPVTFPNGMAFLPGTRTVMLAETFASRINAMVLDDDGDIGRSEVLVDLGGRRAAHPDGIAVGGDGCIWYADPMAGCVSALDASGHEIGILELPFAHPTACCLDETGDTLFVTGTDAMPGPDLAFRGEGAVAAVPGARSRLVSSR